MAVIGVFIWVVSAVLAYFAAEAATFCCNRKCWDRRAREFSLVCSILLGPIFLLISAELLLLALIGEGLTEDHSRRYRDS
jgi:hypothetical protein